MRDDAGRGTDESEGSSDGARNGWSEGDSWDEDRTDATPDATGEAVDDETPQGNVAGEFRPSEPLEPESPDLGNALFVVFGAYLAVLTLTRLFVDVDGFDGRDLLVLTAGMLLISVVFLGFLGLLTPDT